MKAAAKSFAAVLERMPGNLGWVIVRVPLDVQKVWGVRGQLRIRGTIAGFEFRGCLFPTGKGTHYLLVNKKMQKGGHVRAGMTAKFRLEPDLEKRTIEVPAEWVRMLKQEKAIATFVARMSHSMRRYVSQWVGEPKSAASRRKRAEQMAERILETIEAERELPPLVRRAFAASPKAWQGWQSMTPNQRRSHLLGIFGYRSPDSRQRRLDKAVEEALKRSS